jgi:hypothetical protein
MTGKTLIYVGPTLYGCDVPRGTNEIWLPPAGQGDLLLGVLTHNPQQIVLIDGTFFHTLSVWVKEILYALADGIRVIGCSSMGAIRAAECWRYGMVGVGNIYEAYRNGSIQDDAWVAMSYEPITYKILSEPPCGMEQKRLDALEAIRFAREDDTQPEPKVTMKQIRPLVAPIIDKILETEALVYANG